MITHLRDWVKLSHYLGTNFAYVQGAGGNTSIKDDASNLIVKASGLPLQEVTINSGFCVLDYQAVRSGFARQMIRTDDEAIAFAMQLQDKQLPLPSMEFGFHALLDKVVLHSHSVYVNVLTCCEEGEDILMSLFPDSAMIRYVCPGVDLVYAIQDVLRARNPVLIFLQNHGIIVQAADVDICMDAHEQVNHIIREKFAMPLFDVQYPLFEDVDLMCRQVLFPDQAVFIHNAHIQKTLAARYMRSIYKYLLENMARLNLTPRYLAADAISNLLMNESEKYRQKLVK